MEKVIKILWMLEYHTGQETIERDTWVHIRFFYAADEAEARIRAEEYKEQSAVTVYEDKLAPHPHGFNTGKRWFAGRVSVDPDGTFTPYSSVGSDSSAGSKPP